MFSDRSLVCFFSRFSLGPASTILRIANPSAPWPYLEARPNAIFITIQNTVTGVGCPTPSPTLGDTITQSITTVTSVVAICKDNLPPILCNREIAQH